MRIVYTPPLRVVKQLVKVGLTKVWFSAPIIHSLIWAHPLFVLYLVVALRVSPQRGRTAIIPDDRAVARKSGERGYRVGDPVRGRTTICTTAYRVAALYVPYPGVPSLRSVAPGYTCIALSGYHSYTKKGCTRHEYIPLYRSVEYYLYS